MRKVLPMLALLAGLGLSLTVTAPAQAVTRTLTWNASTLNTDGTPGMVTGYTMYRSSDNGTTFVKQVPNTGATVVTWTDTNVPTGNICYEVTALNAAGESARSNRVCFFLPTSPPQAPTSLRESVPLGSVVVTPRQVKRK